MPNSTKYTNNYDQCQLYPTAEMMFLHHHSRSSKTPVTQIRHNQVNAINIETGCNVSKTIITQIHLHGAFVSLDNEHCACLEVLIVKRKNSY